MFCVDVRAKCILLIVDLVSQTHNNKKDVPRAGHFSEYPIDEVFGVLKSSEKGLTQREAARRLKVYGENTIRRSKRFVWLWRIALQLRNPIVLILLVSSIVLYLIGYTVDAHIILAVLVINLTITFFQERKVSRAFALLRNVDQQYASVLRDGKQIEVAASNLVPGDIVFFKSGSKIPADVRIVQKNSLQVNESILTGEWMPVNKRAITLASQKPLAEQVNMAWKGTTVVTGDGKGVVVGTGGRTAVGDIAKELYEDDAGTPLQQQIRTLAQWIMGLVFLSVFVIVVIAVSQGTPIKDMMITAIAIAIAGIPSGLPAAITVVLVLGMQSALKHNGLVRNMLAAETLGSTTWILTDKTGTLTNGTMALSEIIYADTREVVSDETISSVGRSVVHNAYLATDGKRLHREHSDSGSSDAVFQGTAIEQSLVHACEAVCADVPSRDKRVAYMPFSSSKKYSSAVTREHSGEQYYYAVGAPEIIIDQAERVYTRGAAAALTNAGRDGLREKLAEEAGKGHRVIAVGFTKIDADAAAADEAEHYQQVVEGEDHAITFLALLSFEDAIRDDVPEAVRKIRDSYIALTMVTGDNQHTAFHIAEKSGIVADGDSREFLTGEIIEGLSDEELFTKAKTVKVFARMAPDQKSRLLRVLLDRKEVVAMTGDGVNDAPSLHRASIGIAVASGTDVAKEASDLILLKDSFSTITASITEGRKTIRNLKKILIYLLSTSFSEVILVAGGLLATTVLPITPVQILWANIIEEAFMAFAFAFEKEDADITKRSPRDERARSIISTNVQATIIILAFMTGLFLFGVYIFLSFLTDLSHAQIQTVMFLTVSIDSVFMAISLKRLNKSIFTTNLFDNKWLIIAICAAMAILGVAFITPPLAAVLSVVSVPLWVFLIIPISAFFHITVIEVLKVKMFKRDYPLPAGRRVVHGG